MANLFKQWQRNNVIGKVRLRSLIFMLNEEILYF